MPGVDRLGRIVSQHIKVPGRHPENSKFICGYDVSGHGCDPFGKKLSPQPEYDDIVALQLAIEPCAYDIAARRNGGFHGDRGHIPDEEHEPHTQKKKEAAPHRCGPFSY